MLGFSADDVSGHLQTGLKGQPPIDAKGLTALRAITNATVHMVIASGGGAETCEPTLANKEQFAQQLLAVSTSAAMLPCGTASRPCGNETKLYNYTVVGYFLDWEFGPGNNMSCWTPLWRYVAGVLHRHGLELGFDIDNSQYNLTDPDWGTATNVSAASKWDL